MQIDDSQELIAAHKQEHQDVIRLLREQLTRTKAETRLLRYDLQMLEAQLLRAGITPDTFRTNDFI